MNEWMDGWMDDERERLNVNYRREWEKNASAEGRVVIAGV